MNARVSFPFCKSDDSVANAYRLRFEAAEARYTRMKALVCTTTEENTRLRLRLASCQDDMPMQGADGTVCELMCQLRSFKAEVERLSEINSRLSSGLPMTMPLPVDKAPLCEDVQALEVDLSVARKETDTLQVELGLMSSLLFEDDERFQEYETVLDQLTRARLPGDDRIVPWTCQDPECERHAVRLQGRLAVVVADAYVRDRDVRVRGHFQNAVLPLETLRREKDAQIERLRLQLRRLEYSVFKTVGCVKDVDVDDAVVRAGADLERLYEECGIVTKERDALLVARAAVEASLIETRGEAEEANRVIAEGAQQMGLCKAELHRLKRVEADAERLLGQIRRFQEGGYAEEFGRRTHALLMIEEDIEQAQRRLQDVRMQDKMADADESEACIA